MSLRKFLKNLLFENTLVNNFVAPGFTFPIAKSTNFLDPPLLESVSESLYPA